MKASSSKQKKQKKIHFYYRSQHIKLSPPHIVSSRFNLFDSFHAHNKTLSFWLFELWRIFTTLPMLSSHHRRKGNGNDRKTQQNRLERRKKLFSQRSEKRLHFVFVVFRLKFGCISAFRSQRRIHFKQIGRVTSSWDVWRYTTPPRRHSPVLLKSPRAIIIFHVGGICANGMHEAQQPHWKWLCCETCKSSVRVLKRKFLFCIRFSAHDENCGWENYEEFFIVGTWKDPPRFHARFMTWKCH